MDVLDVGYPFELRCIDLAIGLEIMTVTVVLDY